MNFQLQAVNKDEMQSENSFETLANRWCVFRKPFMLEPRKLKTITLAAITLHNWLWEKGENKKIYIPEGLIDHENIETGEIFLREQMRSRGHGIHVTFT